MIFYEHVNYFRLNDFFRMFGQLIVGRHSFGGQYLSIVADLALLRSPTFDGGESIVFPENFGEIIKNPRRGEAPSVIWGGASKGVIYCLLRQRAGVPVERVIDINPAKQGRYLPGTGLLVCSPDEALAELAPG
jgi:hypothetical protein